MKRTAVGATRFELFRLVTFGLLVAGWSHCLAAGENSDYFPPADGAWDQIDPGQAGWDVKQLDEALAFACERRSSAVVVVHRGRLVAERYWDLDPPMTNSDGEPNPYFHMLVGKDSAGRPIEDVASVQKSIVALLTAIAQQKGFVQLSDPVAKHLGTGWSKATREEESKITLRHLLTMTSGLDTRLQFESPAGTKWRYNTTAYSKSLQVLAVASKLDENELTRKWLTEAIGMADSKWVARPWVDQARDANRFGFATTARDLARVGLLVLRTGNWNGLQVIEDRAFLSAAFRPSQQLNPSYGYLWWLNGQSHVRRGERLSPGPLIPEAPDDLVAGLGALGRKLYVVPSMDLVVTRLGENPDGEVADASQRPVFQTEFCRRIFAAAPQLQTPR